MSTVAFNDGLGLIPDAPIWENFTRWMSICVVFGRLINSLMERTQPRPPHLTETTPTEDEMDLLGTIRTWVENEPSWQAKRNALERLWTYGSAAGAPNLTFEEASLAWEAFDQFRRQNQSLQMVQTSLAQYFATQDSAAITIELLQHVWNAIPPCLKLDRGSLEESMQSSA